MIKLHHYSLILIGSICSVSLASIVGLHQQDTVATSSFTTTDSVVAPKDVYSDINEEIPENLLKSALADQSGVLQFYIAQVYKNGTHRVQRDLEAYNEWLSQSVENGFDLALYERAMYLKLNADYSDQEETISLFARAAKKGHANSQFELANAYRDGDVIDQNYNAAHYWFSEASKKGVAKASYVLGMMYQSGEGVAVNEAKAMEYFAKASDLNHPESQYMLGMGYYVGVGVNRDFSKAYELFQKSMANGNVNAWEVIRAIKVL